MLIPLGGGEGKQQRRSIKRERETKNPRVLNKKKKGRLEGSDDLLLSEGKCSWPRTGGGGGSHRGQREVSSLLAKREEGGRVDSHPPTPRGKIRLL